jgi:hypothetical protein
MTRKMNKKFVAFLIPLLLLPMISFGYAHFTDNLVKKYRVHVGSVILEFEAIHLDYAKMPDVDNDGVIWGDELIIEAYENPDDCTWYVEITANPMAGGFILNTTMWLHNAGKLPFELDWNVLWDGPYEYYLDDGTVNPEWDAAFTDPPTRPLSDLEIPPWSFDMKVYRWHDFGAGYERMGPYDPTQVHYKPCDYIEVKQHINFEQPNPANPDSATWQKDWQCKFIKLWVWFSAQDVYEELLGSETIGEIPDLD